MGRIYSSQLCGPRGFNDSVCGHWPKSMCTNFWLTAINKINKAKQLAATEDV